MKFIILIIILYFNLAFSRERYPIEATQPNNSQKGPDPVQILDAINVKSSTIATSPDGTALLLFDSTAAAYTIFDITDPSYPKNCSSIPLNNSLAGSFKAIISSDSKTAFAVNLLYNGTFVVSGELLVIDLSNLTSPSVLANYPLSFEVTAAVLSPDDQILFIASDAPLFMITAMDVSDLSSPNIISSYPYNQTQLPCTAISLVNNYLLCSDASLLHIFNISDAKSIHYLNNFDAPDPPAIDMATSFDGKYGFVLRKGLMPSLQVLDISDPTSIKNISSITFGSSNLQYDRRPLIAVTPDNKHVFLAGFDNLIVVNVSEITNLSFKSINTIYSPSSGILSSDGRQAFVMNSHQIVLTEVYLNVQVNQAFSLKWNAIKKVPPTKKANLQDIIMSPTQSTIFMLYPTRLEIIDVSNLTSPVSISLFNFTGQGKTRSIAISPDDNIAFIGHSKSLVILNITNLTAPTSLSIFPVNMTYNSPTNGVSVTPDGRTVFAPTKSGLEIIDVSKLNSPASLNTYPAPESYVISSFTLSSDAKTAFIAFYNEKSEDIVWKIIDISDLLSPVELSSNHISMELYKSSMMLTPNNQYLFLALGTSENNLIYIFNVSDPKSPNRIEWPDIILTRAYPLAISASSSTIFISAFPRILAIDISTITSPRILRSYLRDQEFRMILSKDETTAFVGRTRGALVIVDLQPEYTLYMLKNNFVLGEAVSNSLEPLQRNQAKNFDLINQSFSFLSVSLYSINVLPSTQSTSTPKTYSALPNWIVFDQNQGTLTFVPTSPAHMGSYQIYGTISTQIPKNAFVGIANITNETESFALITSLITLGYMDTKRFLTPSFDPSTDLVLVSQYSPYKSEIQKKMVEYYTEMTTSFSVGSSLSLEFSQHISVSTKSQNTLSITFTADTPSQTSTKAQFVSNVYAAVSAISSDRSTISIEGSLVDINAALTQILITLDSDTIPCNGVITVSDGLNPSISMHVDNLSQYFEIFQAPIRNREFSIQNEIDDTTIATGQQFVISINNMFSDPNGKELEYSLDVQDGSSVPEWLMIRGETIIGTPPNELSLSDLKLIITASNQFKSASETFDIKIKISLSYALTLLLRYGGVVITLVGLWIYIHTIYNTFCKKRYRYPKDFLIVVGDENSVQSVPVIGFIAEEVKASKEIFREIKENIAKELKCKSINTEKLVDYFVDSETRQLKEDKLIHMVNRELATVVNNTTSVQNKSSPTKEYLRKEIIYQLLINKIVMKQLTLPKEKLTNQVFNVIKQDWPDLIETCDNPIGFKVNRDKLRRKLQSIGVNQPSTKTEVKLLCQSDHLVGLKKLSLSISASDNEQSFKGSDIFGVDGRQLEETPLEKKNKKSKEICLVNSESRNRLKSGLFCVNFELLERAIIAHAFPRHNLNIKRDQIRVVAKKKASSPILFQRLREFLKTDLLLIEFHWGNESIYGIKCKIPEKIFRLYGTPDADLKNKKLVIQITNRRGRILQEIWLNCISNNFEEEVVFNEEVLDFERQSR